MSRRGFNFGSHKRKQQGRVQGMEEHRLLTYLAITGAGATVVSIATQKAPVVGRIVKDISDRWRGGDDDPTGGTGEGFGPGGSPATGGGVSEFVWHGVDFLVFSALAYGVFVAYRYMSKSSFEGGTAEVGV